MNNPLTKPSRTNRKMKRRWKKPKSINNTQRGLTSTQRVLNLSALSQKTKVGRENLIKPRPNRPLLNAVFLCLYILKAVLIRLSSFMACFCGQRSALAAPWCSFLTPLKHAAQYCEKYQRRLFPLPRSYRMNTSSTPAQSEQPTPNLNDLTLAFAKVCFDYGAIIEAGTLDKGITNRLTWLISDLEKLSLAAQDLYSEVAGGDL